jgi:hypothetical protein
VAEFAACLGRKNATSARINRGSKLNRSIESTFLRVLQCIVALTWG